MSLDLVTTNTILYCRQWESCVRFYRDRLGLPMGMANEWFVEFVLTDTARLSLADERRASVKSAGEAGLTLTLQIDDLEAARAMAIEAGIDPTEIRDHPWGARLFNVYDPEGRRIEIWQPVGCETETSTHSSA